MKRCLALALAAALVLPGIPAPAFAQGQQVQAQNGQVTGTAKDHAGQPVANHGVRLRNMADGEVVAVSSTDNAGVYTFSRVPAATYLVELVDDAGAVIAVSSPVSVSSGQLVTGVALTVGASAGEAAAAGGSFFASTKGIILLSAGAGAAVAAVAGKDKNKSKHRDNDF